MNIVIQADVVDWNAMSVAIGYPAERVTHMYLFFKLNGEWRTSHRLLREAAVDCCEELNQFTDLADWLQQSWE